MITPDPSGWTVAVTHPDTGRVHTPDVLDSPALNPGPNALPRLRLPVRKDDVWLDSAYDDDPTMRVWRDGDRVPVEVLRDVEQREDRTILIGVGGVELEGRAEREYNDDRRHVAADDLVTAETGYAVDAPEPDTETLEDVSQQTVDSEVEWVNALADTNDDADLWEVTGDGKFRRRRTAYFADTDSLNDTRGTESFEQDTFNFINADIWEFDGVAVQNGIEAGVEHTFDIDHVIPGENVSVAARMAFPVDQGDGTAYHQGYTQRVNGTELDPIPADFFGVQDPPEWEVHGGSGVPDVGPGPVDVEFKLNEESAEIDQAEVWIDAIMIFDDRHPPTLIDEVTQDSDRNAQVDFYNGSSVVETSGVASPFSIAAGRLDAVYNSTAGDQSIGISNDQGVTWTDAANSETVEADFTDPSSRIRARFEVGGVAGETPNAVGQVLPHEVDAYELFADITQELLLIEETFDNDIASILTSIAEPAERAWRFAFEDGTPTVRFVQNGQFTADFTPEFEDRTREKLGKTYDVVTIKGSHEPISNEPYSASITFTDLGRENIKSGSETVYDDTTNYERNTDYEIRYSDGEIRATSGGDLTVGNDYRIDYEYQAQGTFTSPDAPADPDELVETVPGVTSTRLAEQVAFVIASDVQSPRYAAEVTIPDPDPRFDPVEALPPTALGLPDGVSDLEVRGEPELTARGLRVRFGTRPTTERNVSRLSRQVSRVSDRS